MAETHATLLKNITDGTVASLRKLSKVRDDFQTSHPERTGERISRRMAVQLEQAAESLRVAHLLCDSLAREVAGVGQEPPKLKEVGRLTPEDLERLRKAGL